MKLEINLDNEILDYINEDELKRDVKYNVEVQIKEQIKSLVDENKERIQQELIYKIVQEVMNDLDFGSKLKEVLYNKIMQGIEYRYNPEDSFHIIYDVGIPDIIKDIYEKNKDIFNKNLKKKLDDALTDYKIDNYVISKELTEILTNEEKYTDVLKQLLDDRLYEIIDKI